MRGVIDDNNVDLVVSESYFESIIYYTIDSVRF